MQDWLIGLSDNDKTEDQLLQEALESLPPDELMKLAYDINPTSRPTAVEDLQIKIAQAEQHGRELAAQHGNELEKQALLGLLAKAGKGLMGAVGGGGGAAAGGLGSTVKNIAKDVATSKITSGIGNTLSSAKPSNVAPMAGAAQGGGVMKYAGVASAVAGAAGKPGIGQQVAGFFHRNPGAGVALAGAGVGALTAGRDPQTGQKQYLRGAMMGGLAGAAADAVADGRIGNKMKQMVTRQNNPVLGQGARRYMTESALATRPGGGGAAANLAKRAPSAGAPELQPFPGHTQGPLEGAVKLAYLKAHINKVANQQTLNYDPATKTFTRVHQQPSLAANQLDRSGMNLGQLGVGDIQQGHQEPVRRADPDPYQRKPVPQTAAPAGTPGQQYASHGGDVMSSAPAPAPRVAPAAQAAPVARAAGTPPPIPAAARRAVPPPIPAAARAMKPAAGLAGAIAKIAGSRFSAFSEMANKHPGTTGAALLGGYGALTGAVSPSDGDSKGESALKRGLIGAGVGAGIGHAAGRMDRSVALGKVPVGQAVSTGHNRHVMEAAAKATS